MILHLKLFVQYQVCSHIVQRFLYLVCSFFGRFLGNIWQQKQLIVIWQFHRMILWVILCYVFDVYFGFRVLFFISQDSVIFMVSRLFNLILLRLFRYLGFLCFEGLSWASVPISLNLFSVSINEILDLCLLDSFFQGDFSFRVKQCGH